MLNETDTFPEDVVSPSFYGEKLEAHISTCAIYWIEYLLSQNYEGFNLPPKSLCSIFTHASSVVLQKDILTYFTNEVKIKNLQKQVAFVKLESRMAKSTKSEEPDKVNSFDNCEKNFMKDGESTSTNQSVLEESLEELKLWKTQFESKHCPVVNPFVVYCCMKDVLQQLAVKEENSVFQNLYDEINGKWESLKK